ncbi:MAG: hypothetical protein ABL932_20330, partial [Terricaulis sp.]
MATLFVLGGMASLYAMGAGIWRPDFTNVPGVNPQDMAALAAPYDASLVESNAGTQAEIDRIQTLLPPGAPTSSRLTTFRAATGTDGNHLWGVREYEYPDHVVRAETTLYRAAASDPWKVSGFNVNVLSRAELAGRTFDPVSEPPGVQAVIAAAVIFPLFMLFTFWVALFRRGLKARWIWLVAVVLGVGTIYADTASDALSFLPISVQLFGAGAT